jgi:beta-glucuronidase
MINRDKNHPSVLMWSLANEPAAGLDEASSYFSLLVNFTRPIALGRPITFVTYFRPNTDKCVEFFDVICINRYFGWSDNFGRWDQVTDEIQKDLDGWRSLYPKKPIIFSEYGAETIPGLHSDPPLMFTEEFQKDFYTTYHAIFNNVSSILHPNTGYLVGELPWNMFDFATKQSVKRVGSLNNKGLFTRQRQPKAAAFIIKNRYEQLELIPTPPRGTF